MSKAGKQWRLHWNLSGGSSRLLLGIPPTGLLLSFLPLIFFSSLRPPPFPYKTAPDPQGEHYCSKVEGPYLFPPLPGFRVKVVALSHNLAQFDRYIGAALCRGRTKARPRVLSEECVRRRAAFRLYERINGN